MGEKRVSRTAKLRKIFGHPPHRAKTPFRAGRYARVTTQDQQTIPMQTRALRDYATRRGWTIAMQVKEIGSGATRRERREQLREAARAKRWSWFWSGNSTGERMNPQCEYVRRRFSAG
jgi:hypothetical protein